MQKSKYVWYLFPVLQLREEMRTTPTSHLIRRVRQPLEALYFRTCPNNPQWVLCALLEKFYYTFNIFISSQIIRGRLFIR